MAHAEIDGLTGADYILEEAYAYIATQDAPARAEIELLISASIVPYAHDMLNGRYADKPRWDMTEVITPRLANRSVDEFMQGLIPAKIEYLRLREHLAVLRAEKDEAKHIPLFSKGGTCVLGIRGRGLANCAIS